MPKEDMAKAKFFYDYATLKLGVPEDNVLELINDGADRIELKERD